MDRGRQDCGGLRRLWDNRTSGAVALLSIGLAALPVRAQCQYDVTVLQYPINCSLGETVLTAGVAMNSSRAVVGYYKCPIWTHSEAFRWTPEDGFTTLQRPAGVVSAAASDINDDGVICGSMDVVPGGYHGFIYDHGVWTDLPPVIPEQGFSYALAISNAGVVVGQRSIVPNSAPYNAFIWSASTGFLDLGVMGGPNSSAVVISESQFVVGWSGIATYSINEGFIWQDGALTFLGAVPGGYSSVPLAATEDRAIVGYGEIPMKGFPAGLIRAFLWQQGRFTLLEPLSSDVFSQAKGVNARGQVIGRSYTVEPYGTNATRGFLWQHGAMVDLNALISPGLGIYVETVTDIADDGTILAHGNSKALLLRPVGVPVGDLDLDCRVSTADFLMLLTAWGPCPETGDCTADLNGDAVVGYLDFLMLLDNWG